MREIDTHVSPDSVVDDFMSPRMAAAEEYGGRQCYNTPFKRSSISKRSISVARSRRRNSVARVAYPGRLQKSKKLVMRGGAP